MRDLRTAKPSQSLRVWRRPVVERNMIVRAFLMRLHFKRIEKLYITKEKVIRCTLVTKPTVGWGRGGFRRKEYCGEIELGSVVETGKYERGRRGGESGEEIRKKGRRRGGKQGDKNGGGIEVLVRKEEEEEIVSIALATEEEKEKEEIENDEKKKVEENKKLTEEVKKRTA